MTIWDKPLIEESDIKFLLDNNAEESINLDFKAAGALDKTQKKEIGKDISAFANSAGGAIVYGINEKNHKAESMSFIDGNIITKEWLEQVIQSNIQRKINGLLIHPIRIGNDIRQTVYVVQIPESDNAPHMASDNRFYKRYNFESVPMEEYEVRQLYNRKQRTKLIIDDFIIDVRNPSTVGQKLINIRVSVGIQIKNISQSIEDKYKIEISVPKLAYQKAHPYVKHYEDVIRQEEEYYVLSIPNKSPLFQEETTTHFSFSLQFFYESFMQAVNNPIKVKLYYSNGIDKKELLLPGKVQHGLNFITPESFHRS